MPRPQKKRYVCCVPQSGEFVPKGNCFEKGHCKECAVVLTVDEYETIRLIDLEEMTQEEASLQMQVSRTTVQGIYNSARKKVADALVNSKRLLISGGDYVVCNHYGKQCGKGCHGHCKKRRCNMNLSEDTK